jgi:ATP-dependent helicase/nuclease subunit A
MSPFTEFQKRAIDAKGNVLVSAGAGTGKTGTVIARCLRLILEEQCSVENILMVTFTEAAAAEMRARLRRELEKTAASLVGEARLHVEEQLALLDTAHISTLHGFGLQLVREHFHELAIDPQVSVLDESQTQPLIHATLDALLEQCYEGKSPIAEAVLALIRNYGGGSEERIRSLVLRLHRYSQTLPHPERWLTAQLEHFAQSAPTGWRELFAHAVCDWRAEFADDVTAHSGCENVAACVAALNQCPDRPAFDQAAAVVRCVAEAFQREWVRGTAGKYRNPLKKFFERARFLASLIPQDGGPDPMLEDWNRLRGPMRALLELARAFTQEFTRAKRALGGIDFADIEQLALACLLDADERPTATARAWQERFEHVFVDEYQDINAAQDAILRAVSRDGTRANRFLVGDVKQSIYRFRLADPTIFRSYEERWREGQDGSRVPLADNFRSRERLLDFVNPLFAELMRPEMGGIHYDADARLRFGSPVERPSLSSSADPAPRVELHVIHGADVELSAASGEEEASTAEVVDVDKVELEARLVARRLQALREEHHLIWDAGEKRLREVDWKDMVVLLRSPGPRLEAFAKEFSRAGIPLTAARAGFFSALEIGDLLNILRLLDNPLQDIPLAAVLRSPLFGFSADELAIIRVVAGRHGEFFTALNRFHHKGSSRTSSAVEASARQKVQSFRRSFEKWRRLLRHTSLSQCLETILAETQYEALLLAEERGRERAANVQRLLELARSYDPYQRQGLYRFLRFVEEQEESGLDQDVAAVETGNAVRLMSIHASKGLEFPVVALACLGAQFNQTDLRQDILLSPRLGLCAKIVCPESERRYPSLPWWCAKQIEKRELLGEELRLLYVAMTRARDTLVLTGFDGTRGGESPWASGRSEPLHTRELLSARSYWDWLKLWLASSTQPGQWQSDALGRNELLTWRRWKKAELTQPDEGMAEATSQSRSDAHICDLDSLRTRLTWNYSYRSATTEPAKSNVSALRRRAAEIDDEVHRPFAPARRVRAATGLSASDIGSAHHAFLQRVDLGRVGSLIELRGEAERFVNESWLTRDEATALDGEALLRFWQSPLGRALVAAPGNVRRELPFTARFSIAQLRDLGLTRSDAAGEFVIVQGVVDLAVVDDEGIDVLDFKTDRVTPATVPEKAREYAPQLKLYAAALHAIYGRPVRSASLHFLATGETWPISVQ